jgi:hypothetical protein
VDLLSLLGEMLKQLAGFFSGGSKHILVDSGGVLDVLESRGEHIHVILEFGCDIGGDIEKELIGRIGHRVVGFQLRLDHVLKVHSELLELSLVVHKEGLASLKTLHNLLLKETSMVRNEG